MSGVVAPLELRRARDRPRGHRARVPRGIRIRRLGRLRGLTVWLVDGERVRGEVHIDFVAGGSDARYSYIPKNEVWIEAVMTPLDRAATLLHEVTERGEMVRGATYDRAHETACVYEERFRSEGREIDESHIRLVERLIDEYGARV